MKKNKHIITVLGLALLLINCAMFKNYGPKLELNPPFKILEATYNARATSNTNVKGYAIKVVINNNKINLDSVFFRNIQSQFKLEKTQPNKTFTSKPTLSKLHDYNLDIDSKNEFGNKPPGASSKLVKFPLEKSEAIISYSINNKVKYYKVVLNKMETLYMVE